MGNKQATQKHQINLEESKLWQLAVTIERETRIAVKTVPGAEYFRLADGAMNSATYLAGNIARIVGRDTSVAASDYRFTRADLFILKGLLNIAREHKFVHNTDALQANIDKMQTLLDEEIAAREEQDKPKD